MISTAAGGLAGRLDLVVEANATGGFDIVWSAQELEPGTQEPIGAELHGEGQLPAVCCELLFDVHLPGSDLAYRFEVRGDWEAEP